jgi:hypothetical protein
MIVWNLSNFHFENVKKPQKTPQLMPENRANELAIA